MKTKVLVIPVNLGASIDDIIATNEIELSKDTQSKLDTVINAAKAVQELKEKKEQEKNEKLTNAARALETVFKNIEEAGNAGYRHDLIKQDVERANYSMTALTVKLKVILEERKPGYQLEKVKREKIQYFRFIKLD